MRLLHFLYIIDYVKWLFFVFAIVGKGGAKAGFRVMLKYFEIKKSFICSSLFRYYIKQKDSISPCVCSVIDHKRGQNVVRTSVTHSATPRVPLFCPYHILTVILAFWLVLAYDPLEDRRIIDIVITEFYPPCFKMAKSFENLDNVLRDWAKDKGQKSLAEALNRFEKQEEET